MKTKVVNIKGFGDCLPKNLIKVCRPSIYGNPFQIGNDGTRQEVIEKFKRYFYNRIENDQHFKLEVDKLKGHLLGCVCKPLPCHGDIYVEYLEKNLE